MEEVQNLIDVLKTCSTAFLNVEHVKDSLRESEASVVQKILDELTIVMKFIDEKIITFDNEFYNGNNYQGKQKFYNEKAIEICSKKNDYSESKFYWIRAGYLIILTRSMKFMTFDREGHYSQYQNSAQKLKYTNATELTIKDVLKQCKFETIIIQIKNSIDKAIKNNENKFPILKKRLELINSIKNQL